jgi:quinol monooxygenase YgiN
MSQSTLHIVARIVAKPDTVTQLQAVLTALLEPTRQEAGCQRYTLLQNRQDPTDFTFVEEWASDAAIDAHMKTSHVHAAFAQAQGLLAAEPDIRRYELVR